MGITCSPLRTLRPVAPAHPSGIPKGFSRCRASTPTSNADGVGIAVNEWGDERSVLVMVHGGADFSRAFDVFAPLLQQPAGGHRMGPPQPGTAITHLYSFKLIFVTQLVCSMPLLHTAGCRLGHSKGGSILTSLAEAQPFRVSFINLDSGPYRRPGPDLPEYQRRRPQH